MLWQLQIWKTKRREQRTLNSNKEPFQHKRVLQNATVLNKTITACKEPLKNHIFLECVTILFYKKQTWIIGVQFSKYIPFRILRSNYPNYGLFCFVFCCCFYSASTHKNYQNWPFLWQCYKCSASKKAKRYSSKNTEKCLIVSERKKQNCCFQNW